ncbi:hypothetical protein WG66_007958, partial [Moniliophthora roreri]
LLLARCLAKDHDRMTTRCAAEKSFISLSLYGRSTRSLHEGEHAASQGCPQWLLDTTNATIPTLGA